MTSKKKRTEEKYFQRVTLFPAGCQTRGERTQQNIRGFVLW